MDLDQLLAALQGASAVPADAPLIAVSSYVSPHSREPQADRAAARRMICAFLIWLVHSGRAAAAEEKRRESLESLREARQAPTDVLEALGDQLLDTDLHPEWRAFAHAYLDPGSGHLGDDYFKLFVEDAGKRSLRDADPDPTDYARLAAIIESRAQLFAQADPTWDRALTGPAAPASRLWTGGSRDQWLQRLASYDDLLETPPGLYRTRLDEYWSLVDAAPTPADVEVAAALVRSWSQVDETSIQQSVENALREFPPQQVVAAILRHIVEIERRRADGCTLVDIFAEELDEHCLGQMAAVIAAADPEARAAYLNALRQAREDGSQHAEALLSLF